MSARTGNPSGISACQAHTQGIAGHESADLAQETFLRFVRAGCYRERGKPIAHLR